MDERFTKSEPTTGEIVRALRGGGIYGITTALALKIIDRLESQEKTIAELTARAESAEKERDAAIADIEELLGQDDFIGICWACKSHDKCVATRDVKITCIPKWSGLRREEMKK